MATHDYVIDNSTGANVRADLNLVLQAILSNNSSSSAPSTTAAYMWWADTSNGILKIRNSANNAWVELLQLDGTLTLEDGSASTPGLAFRDDLNTGIFSSAADTFNVATAGVERIELGATTIFNEDGADVDFRIEGDTNANLFYVNAGTNFIGIGTASPQQIFHVYHATDNGLALFESGDANCRIDLKDNGGQVSIEGIGNELRFGTSSSNTERMRIDSSGNLLHGFTANENTTGNSGTKLITAGDLQIDGDQKALVFRAAASTAQKQSGIQWWNETGAGVQCAIFGIREAVSEAPGALAFYTSNDVDTSANNGEGNITERMRLDSDGTLCIGTTSDHGTGDVISVSGSAHIMEIQNGSTAGHRTLTLRHARASGSTAAEQIVFEAHDGGAVGSIQSTGSATFYNTTSDYRLKENESAISDGITRLKTLKPYRFNFKVDASTTVDGFFAHEVTAVPEAITGTKDAVVTQAMIDAGEYEEGTLNDPIYQGIDQSKLVPLLVAAVQELITKVETLEAA